MAVLCVECDCSTGRVESVVVVHSVSSGAYGFFRPSVLRPTAARPAESQSAPLLACAGLCDRSLLVIACEESSTLVLVDCTSWTTVARLETEEREASDDGTSDNSSIASLLPPGRFTRFKRRYGMVMCAQLYRTTNGRCASTASTSAADPLSLPLSGQRCAGCELYAVCGMESGHVAVFRLQVATGPVMPRGDERSHVLSCPLVCEVKLHDEPGQLTAGHATPRVSVAIAALRPGLTDGVFAACVVCDVCASLEQCLLSASA